MHLQCVLYVSVYVCMCVGIYICVCACACESRDNEYAEKAGSQPAFFLLNSPFTYFFSHSFIFVCDHFYSQDIDDCFPSCLFCCFPFVYCPLAPLPISESGWCSELKSPSVCPSVCLSTRVSSSLCVFLSYYLFSDSLCVLKSFPNHYIAYTIDYSV